MTAVTLVVIPLAAALLMGLSYRFGETLFPGIYARYVARQARRHGIDAFFNNRGADTTSVLLFTLSARKYMPLTDILYFEYLRFLLISQRTSKVIIGRWHPTGDRGDLFTFDDSEDWSNYDEYVNSLFQQFLGSCEIVDGKDILNMHHGALPPLFWRSLDRVSDPIKYKSVVQAIQLTRSEQRQIRKRKPGDRLKGFVGHTINNTMLAPLVVQEIQAASTSAHPPTLGVLFWGMEVDRLAVFLEIFAAQGDRPGAVPQFSLVAIAGKTIRGTRGHPSDNHSATNAVSFTDSEGSRISAISKQSRGEAKQYRAAVSAVLRSNYSISHSRKVSREQGAAQVAVWQAARGERTTRLTKVHYELIHLTSELARAHARLRREVSK